MTNVGTTVIAASLMDRAGRKQLLGISFAGDPLLPALHNDMHRSALGDKHACMPVACHTMSGMDGRQGACFGASRCRR